MVTVICDFCGRTAEEIRRTDIRPLVRYERYIIDGNEEPEKFDMCESCLREIRKRRVAENEERNPECYIRNIGGK